MKMAVHRVHNFSAGPSALPLEVLEKAKNELLDLNGSGMSVMEMSHRSKVFKDVLEKAESGLRSHLGIPDDYAVLFLQGGASHQFAMIPLNFYQESKPIDFINTGTWSKKALAEAKKIGATNIVYDGSPDNFLKLPGIDSLQLNSDASYLHMVSNNTIYGTQFKKFPDTKEVPLICDMSSDILSRKIDVSRFGLIFAGAQKNIGPSGLGIIIIRKDLAKQANQNLPTIFQYQAHIDNESLYNTPPTFGIYMVSLVMDWLKSKGGVEKIEEINAEKSNLLYQAIDDNPFYYCPIPEKDRSAMNVVFRITGNNEELEAKFVKESELEGLCNLKGHRSIGGLRASIYNAVGIESVKALIEFMDQFAQNNS